MVAIVSINLSSLAGNSRSPAGQTIGIISVPLAPPNDIFTGVLTLSGANAGDFAIFVAATGVISLQTTTMLIPGAYHINLIATQAGLSNSPFTQAFTIQAIDPTTHQNAPPIPFPQLSTPVVDQQGNLQPSWIRFITNVWSQTNGSNFGLNSNFPAPAAPPTGQGVLYIDPADGGLKVKFPTGNIVVLGMP